MKSLPDRSIDLLVCDLPYGCLEPQRGSRTRSAEYVKKVKNVSVGQSSCAWDIPIDLTQFWVQVKRLCKDDHTPVLMFCSAKFGVELINSNPDWFRYDLVWNKMRGVSFLQANKMPMRSHELIYVFSKKGATYTRKDVEEKCVTSVVTIGKGKGKHPTQKPDDLYAWLIERYSREGDTVLDPTAGSFASVFTAARMGRKAIGIEKDDAFFAKAIQASFVN
jgi:site-specific DNA-methyltransferase (adenine-specific)